MRNNIYLEFNPKYWYLTILVGILNTKLVDWKVETYKDIVEKD